MTENWTAIKAALENKKYKWRTIRGIARETSLDEAEIQRELQAHQESVIRSSVPNKHGENLYTTRTHYRSKASIWDRISSAIQMKVR